MDLTESKKLSNKLILDLRGLQSGRMTLIVSSASELNEKLMQIILGNEVLTAKHIKYLPSYSDSFEELFSMCKEEKQAHGLDLLAIGDIQFFRVNDQVSNYEHMTKLSWNFKRLSKELKCHVMVGLSVENFVNEQMTFRKMKEVGQLDVDSDLILFIQNVRDEIEINIVKNRLGALSKYTK